MSAGKGDRLRPTKKKIFDINFDSITWKINLSLDGKSEIRNYIVKKGKKIYKYP